jgi:purine-cytosine permease-like protein
MQAVEIGPVPPEKRTQPAFDLFLIFAGANIVATTLQVGATLAGSFGLRTAMAIIAVGAVAGAGLVAVLAPLGPRLRVPSIIACRAPLGFSGASALAWLLVVTNFAWIALNDVIAASICASLWGGPSSVRVWAVGLGLVATAIVAGGPRLVGRADRVAVPLLFVSGVVLTIACLHARVPPEAATVAPASEWMRGLDVTAGYQVTWLLMFADYTRYNRSGRAAGLAVFFGLALTALWFMPIGFVAARLAGSEDPGARRRLVGRAPHLACDAHHQLRQYLYVGARAQESSPDGRRSNQRLADRRDRRGVVPAVDGVDHPVRGLHDRARGAAGPGGRHPACAQLRSAARRPGR